MKVLMIFITLALTSCKNPLVNSGSRSGEGSTVLDSINTTPGITNIVDLAVEANKATAAVVFNISDSEQSLDCATNVSASSSNTSLIDASGIVVSGTAPNCQVIMTPKSNQFGEVKITLTLSDGELTAQTSFDLNVKYNPSVVPGLQVWLDADDDKTFFKDSTCLTPATVSGDPVACWLDKSNNFHATMSTLSQVPSLNLIDNKASIEFDGDNDFFDNNHSITTRVVYIVYKVDSSLQNSELGQIWGQYTAGHVAADERSPGLWSFDGNVGQTAQYSLDGNALAPVTGGSSVQAWSDDAFEMIRTQFTSDVAITRQVIGSLFPSFAIGAHQFGGQISEILVYSSIHGAADVSRLEGYLACKWSLQSSLPGGHAFKSTCP